MQSTCTIIDGKDMYMYIVLSSVPLLLHILSTSQEDQTAVRTAEKLLKEVRPKSPLTERKVLVMENYTLLATKSKPNAERALEKFMEMASTEVITECRIMKYIYHAFLPWSETT